MTNLNLLSPTEVITFEGHSFYLKRDDLLHPDFSGNKARKFYYYFIHDFPAVKKIVSYGSAQSNAMYSLSVLAKMRGWKFEYYVDHIADFLKENPHGNYEAALKNGMLIKEERIAGKEDFDSSILFVEEGGRQDQSEYGIRILAEEIIAWQKEQGIEKLNIFLPSGTGTTALFLQKHLPDIKVFTTPCVGDSAYLKKQFLALEEEVNHHPVIVTLEKKHHFGKLYRDNYKIWLKLQQQTGVTFDLLYDPLGWRTLLAHPEVFSNPVLYIHQGGILGNESMLPRYERKYKDLK
ncbi:1-aminocyclopropane-1-carboxylate deaminase/D-cysteine desulfhydrase [Sulfurovum mangrovi]|uniref:1-aminocyclopropane-1-carboxylate deaminase/D-cysteine desulfhydrase n=1 Tax=Sulfurovum mangrovi TaxID=2893889 RepID=UPI001E5AB266|nr:1-aminocyclopropane-1-carboxylate deaminase/D-cysteine desulfhydrase [Sulfurovum mangrovi]UFH58708.1 1-aminocyclopropane-1-carboxylate deaminase/D-cysteine desulfhydrase [Sulfurovum mangrovi]